MYAVLCYSVVFAPAEVVKNFVHGGLKLFIVRSSQKHRKLKIFQAGKKWGQKYTCKVLAQSNRFVPIHRRQFVEVLPQHQPRRHRSMHHHMCSKNLFIVFLIQCLPRNCYKKRINQRLGYYCFEPYVFENLIKKNRQT